MLVAFLYFATAALLLWLANRYVRELSRGAALALLLLPLVFTGRALLTGRIYGPVEMPYITRPLVDHRDALHVPPVANHLLSDIAFQMMPWREATRCAIASGQWPLLNRFQMCGDVLASSAQPAVWSPFTWIALLVPTALSFTFTASIAFFVAAAGAFLFVRELGCSEGASLLGSAVYAFSASMALQVLWPLGFAWALLPFVLTGTSRAVSGPGLRSGGILTVALTLEALAGHPETLLHVVSIAAVYGVFELISQYFMRRPAQDETDSGSSAEDASRAWRSLPTLAAAGLLTLLLSAIALVPFIDAMRQTLDFAIRTGGVQPPFTTRPDVARDALLGDFFPFTRSTTGIDPLERAEAGSIALALAISAVIFIRSRRTWFMAMLLVVLLLAGSRCWPVANLLHLLPLFKIALNQRLSAAVPLFVAALAALAVDVVSARRTAAVLGALFAVVAVAASLVDWPDVSRLVAEVVPLGVAAIMLLVQRAHRVTLTTSAVLIGLLLGQRFIADGALIPTNDSSIAFPRTAVFRAIPPMDEPFRITGRGNTLLPNTAAMYGLEDPRGLSPMLFLGLAETFPLWREAGGFGEVPDVARPMISMMNVRYAMQDVSDPIPPGWRDVTYDVYTRLIENEHVLARAFVPRHVRLGLSAPQQVEEMAHEADFSERAWLDIAESPHERANGPGVATTRYGRNGLRMSVDMNADGFLVVSQTAWRGWRAYVDGRRVKVHRANRAFLAVWVPAGHHKVRLRFLPQSFVVARAITGGTLFLLAIWGTARKTRSVRRAPQGMDRRR